MPLWVKICSYLFPALMFGMAVFLGIRAWDFQSDSFEATGEIVSVRVSLTQSTDSDGRTTTSTSYYPTFRYVDFYGTEHVEESVRAADGFQAEVGMLVPVRYHRKDPTWVQPYFGWFSVWDGPIIVGGVGLLVMLILSLAFYIIERPIPVRVKKIIKWGR